MNAKAATRGLRGHRRVLQYGPAGLASFAGKGYGGNIALQSVDNLVVHRADEGRAVVIEYEVHGIIIATGVRYDNRFCSVIRIKNRKITHWRDYMDSLAAWNALTTRP